jgi:hypothetical protein
MARDREDPRALAEFALAEPVRHGRLVVSLLADVAEETLGDAGSLQALLDSSARGQLAARLAEQQLI